MRLNINVFEKNNILFQKISLKAVVDVFKNSKIFKKIVQIEIIVFSKVQF